MAAIVVAAAGMPVVKHGNRAASRRSGGADMLEALGVRIDLGPDGGGPLSAEVGIGFCFAPVFHPSVQVRRGSAAGDRRAHGIQSAWAAYQSGRPAGGPDRLRVRGPGRVMAGVFAARAGAACWWCTATTGSTS